MDGQLRGRSLNIGPMDVPYHQCMSPNCPGPCRHHDEAHGETPFSRYKFASTHEIVVEAAKHGCKHCTFLSTAADAVMSATQKTATSSALAILLQSLDTGQQCLAAVPGLSIGAFTVVCSTGSKSVQYLLGLHVIQDYTELAVLEYAVGDCQGTSSLPIPCLVDADYALNAASQSSLNVIYGWLEVCKEHTACTDVLPSRYPRRLLDVRQGRVQLSQQDRFTEHYLALSYTWGDAMLPETTRSNLELRLSNALLWQDLPLTIQDAITITRLLNFSFLWVDSLCIVQDSEDDKASEIAKMGAIYGDAFLVISADAAQSPAHGFLNRTQYIEPIEVKALDDTYRLREASTHNLGSYTARRAWCYQERILARRTLVFAQTETMWECRSGEACECRRDTGSVRKRSYWSHTNTAHILNLESLDPGGPAQDRKVIDGQKFFTTSTYEYWLVSIERYSARRLSYMSDKLPAVGALASALQGVNGDRYLAGLWERDLLRGLRWSGRNSMLQREHDVVLRSAPSWSWASVPGPVFWHCKVEINTTYLTSVVDIHCRPANDDAFGRVSNSYIRLHGPCLDVYVRSTDRRSAFSIAASDTDTTTTFTPILSSESIWQANVFDNLPVQAIADAHTAGHRKTIQRAGYKTLEAVVEVEGWCRLIWLTKSSALVLSFSQQHQDSFEKLGYARCKMPEVQAGLTEQIVTVY